MLVAGGNSAVNLSTGKEYQMDLRTLEEVPPWEWPDRTSTMLLGILTDPRGAEPDRLLAAELAGEVVVIDDELAEALLTILRNDAESVKVRGRAALSLGAVLEYMDMEDPEDLDDAPISVRTFRRIRESLARLYRDAKVPKAVRRRILEASVRAPQRWHRDAIRAAYASDDERWKLTGVYGMRFVKGFEEQILEALQSTNPAIHCEAVCAAGNWEIAEAWPHIRKLLRPPTSDKPLLLAAIDAVVGIRPHEAAQVLDDLLDSDDEDIVEAVYEALAMAGEQLEEDEADELPF